ncbi:MAG: right-handed parallel beta-helix repeat-containing protein [Candidatus Coatesbacteria bacterium]|nr:right-handed parallel beta-helix repeat-containing protein [Candidatus Coatesbacteria bacterium]
MRVVLSILMLVAIGTAFSEAAAAPDVYIFADRDCYFDGDIINIDLSGRKFDEDPISVAVYVGILTPDGRLFTLSGSTWSENIAPWIAQLDIPSGFFYQSRMQIAAVEIPSDIPPVGPTGEYTLLAGLSRPGTLDFLSSISIYSFEVIECSEFHGGSIKSDKTLSGDIALTSDVIVAEQAVLTILPGSRVRLGPDVGICTYGGLIAEGLEEKRIVFERLSPDEPWENITFYWCRPYDDKCRLIWCDISGGSGMLLDEYRIGGGVLCISSSPTIERCRITGNAAYNGGGICCLDSTALIKDNNIANNSAEWWGGGIRCTLCYGGPWIIGNTIRENRIAGWSGAGAGICCYAGTNPLIESNLILDNAVEATDGEGGGIYCTCSDAVIRGNVVVGNHASSLGGGLYLGYRSQTIADNIVADNSATYSGGGIWCESMCKAIIENNEITGNSAHREHGGGIYFGSESHPVIRHNRIGRNISPQRGGGIYCGRDSYPSIENNLIYSNESSDGGGIYCNESVPSIIFCTLSGNMAENLGEAIYCSQDGELTISDCIVWGGSSALHGCLSAYCCIDAAYPGEGNIHADPIFVEGPLGEYYLAPTSPCIDAGSRLATDAGLSDRTTQADGTPDTGIADMGYHHQITASQSQIRRSTR